VLYLLQHRIWKARGKGISGDKQDREPVSHGNTCCGNHVGGSWSNRRGSNKNLLTPGGFSKSCGSKAHALLVLASVGWQFIAMHLKGMAQAGYVSVAKDSHGSWKQWHILAINHDALSN
jgi:hypothetical protein